MIVRDVVESINSLFGEPVSVREKTDDDSYAMREVDDEGYASELSNTIYIYYKTSPKEVIIVNTFKETIIIQGVMEIDDRGSAHNFLVSIRKGELIDDRIRKELKLKKMEQILSGRAKRTPGI